MTYTPTAEHSKQIRQALKAKYGWTGQDVSVRTDNYSMGSSIRISIKSPKVCAGAVEEVANDHESVSRCELTGDILSGGNRFVFVSYTDDCRQQIGAPYREQIDALEGPEKPGGGWVPKQIGRCEVGLMTAGEQPEWNREFTIQPLYETPDNVRTARGDHDFGDLRCQHPVSAAFWVGYYSDILPARLEMGDTENDADDQDQAEGPVDSAPGVAFQRNTEKGGLELVFEEKPSDTVRLKLKTNKWRWSRKQGLWYTRQSAAAEEIARWVVDKYRSGATEDESHTDPYSSPDAFDMMVEDDMCRRAGA